MDKLSLIRIGMSKSEVINLLGDPQLETGFGLDIYLFEAETFTLQTGFGSDGLLYAYLMNKDGSVKEKIVY
jgi:outer membrane protein assembly factor BamE (lipoprotein component of BamABCDE complex)